MTSASRNRAVSVETAQVHWQASGEPVSELFNDRYFSASGGLSESRHVFIGHNDLPLRLANLATSEVFTVAETGFGTGLNFLATVDLWHETAVGGWLHFVSFERYPLSLDDLGRALSRWPELAPFVTDLMDQYPPPLAGVHRLIWPGRRVRLTLYFGDALEGLKALPFTAQAWYLDGFDPRTNSGLWNETLYRAIAEHSADGTTFATYTSAGAVRRGLAAVGFQIEKVPGHKPKREMSRGRFSTAASAPFLAPGTRRKPARVIIVGAGIAGCLMASNLARRGCAVTLVEAGAGPGSGASGNLQGALYVKLGVDYTAQSELALAALVFAQRYYSHMQAHLADGHEGQNFWNPTGLLLLATTAAEADRQQRFMNRHEYPEGIFKAVSALRASELANMKITHPGLHFPDSGWLAPYRLCQALAGDSGIELRSNTRLDSFGHDGDRHCVDLSAVDDADNPPKKGFSGRHFCDQLILCPGASDILPELDIPARRIRGQVSWWPAQALPSPACVICGEGYINPSDGTNITVGATFDLKDPDPSVRAEDHRRNLDAVGRWLSPIAAVDAHAQTLAQGRTSFRCTTPDYQPLAGVLHPESDLPRTTAGLAAPPTKGRGIAVLAGLGSKGLAYAPLLSEWLCDRICHEVPALPLSLAELVQPQRFTVRRHK